MSAKHVSNKKKVFICNKVFKRLNDDLINVFARKFKSNRYSSSKAKVGSFRIVHKALFKSTQLSHDLDFFISHDFLSIRLKCSKNDWSDVILTNRVLF